MMIGSTRIQTHSEVELPKRQVKTALRNSVTMLVDQRQFPLTIAPHHARPAIQGSFPRVADALHGVLVAVDAGSRPERDWSPKLCAHLGLEMVAWHRNWVPFERLRAVCVPFP